MKNDDFLISGEDQDFAMIPYSKITYQLQDEEDEVKIINSQVPVAP